jgi:hypothetical protein
MVQVSQSYGRKKSCTFQNHENDGLQIKDKTQYNLSHFLECHNPHCSSLEKAKSSSLMLEYKHGYNLLPLSRLSQKQMSHSKDWNPMS